MFMFARACMFIVHLCRVCLVIHNWGAVWLRFGTSVRFSALGALVAMPEAQEMMVMLPIALLNPLTKMEAGVPAPERVQQMAKQWRKMKTTQEVAAWAWSTAMLWPSLWFEVRFELQTQMKQVKTDHEKCTKTLRELRDTLKTLKEQKASKLVLDGHRKQVKKLCKQASVLKKKMQSYEGPMHLDFTLAAKREEKAAENVSMTQMLQ